jgi:lipopolysaccharide export system protein LptA
MNFRHTAIAFATAAVLWLTMASTASAQNAGLNFGSNDQPVEIFADQGIEWHQNESAYIAKGNARAVRADTTVYGQTLTAYYRKGDSNTPKSTNADDASGTQIYRVDADGAVRIVSPNGTAYGDHAVYDVDKGILVMTGSNLRLITERETITSRDTLEYWQQDDMAVARGNALAVSDQKQIAGDLLTAYFTKNDSNGSAAKGNTAAKPAPNRAGAPLRTNSASNTSSTSGGNSDLDRMYAYGNVVVTTPQEVAHGNRGVYNARTGIAILTGAVKITRDQNQLNGDAAEMNLNTNVSRIIAAPASSGGNAPPVRALLVPNEKKSDSDKSNGSNPRGASKP